MTANVYHFLLIDGFSPIIITISYKLNCISNLNASHISQANMLT